MRVGHAEQRHEQAARPPPDRRRSIAAGRSAWSASYESTSSSARREERGPPTRAAMIQCAELHQRRLPARRAASARKQVDAHVLAARRAPWRRRGRPARPSSARAISSAQSHRVVQEVAEDDREEDHGTSASSTASTTADRVSRVRSRQPRERAAPASCGTDRSAGLARRCPCGGACGDAALMASGAGRCRWRRTAGAVTGYCLAKSAQSCVSISLRTAARSAAAIGKKVMPLRLQLLDGGAALVAAMARCVGGRIG